MKRTLAQINYSSPLTIPETLEALKDLEQRFPYRDFDTQARMQTPELGKLVIERAYQIGIGARRLLEKPGLEPEKRIWLQETAETFPNSALEMYFLYDF